MTQATRRAIAIALLFWALAVLLATGADAARKPYRIAAAVRDAEGKWKPEEVLEETRRKVRFQIRYLPPDEARTAVGAALGRELDLFPGRSAEGRPGYLVFALQLDNGSEEDVTFNPGQIRMQTEKGDHEFALDYTALYEVVRRLGPAAPTLEELGSIVFDRVVTIRAGGGVRKLLVFDAPQEDRYKTISVEVNEVNVGTEGEDVIFLFRKFTEES